MPQAQDNNPSNGFQGSSYIYRQGTSPNTRTAVSQKVKILAPLYGSGANQLLQVGALSSFSPNESRNVEAMRGVGMGDQIAELVPSATEPMSASIEKALMYQQNLWQSFGYAAGMTGPVRSLRHHRWPFDIKMELVFSTLADYDMTGQSGVGLNGGDFQGGVKSITFPTVSNDPNGNPGESRDHTAILTLYEACWFTSYSLQNISKDAGMLMESGDVQVSDVHDMSSEYGEFLATGNDPTIGQLGSVRFTQGSP